MRPEDIHREANLIEERLQLDAKVTEAALAKVLDQDAHGLRSWPNPRDAPMPEPPWPAFDDPMLRFLLDKATASLAEGMDPRVVMRQLAVHAWFEGGVDGYDRGQREARTPRSV